MGSSDPKYADWQRDAITQAVHETVPPLSIKRAVAAAARGELGVEPFEVPYSTAAGWCQQHQSEQLNGRELPPEREPSPQSDDDGGGKALETYRQLQGVVDARVARLREQAEGDGLGSADLETEVRRLARMQGELEKLRRQATWKQPAVDPGGPALGDEDDEADGQSDLVDALLAAADRQDEERPADPVPGGRVADSTWPGPSRRATSQQLTEEQRDTIGRAVNEWGIPPDRVASVAGMGLLGYAGGESKTLPAFELTQERAREVAEEWADARAVEAGAA